VSALIRENLREMDLAARYGGEEFVAVLPETDEGGALAVAERIRSSIATHAFGRHEDGHRAPMAVTVSIGVAAYPVHASSPHELIEAADSAMYHAKRAGKDRVESASAL